MVASSTSVPSTAASRALARDKRKAPDHSIGTTSMPDDKRQRITSNTVEYTRIRAFVVTYKDHGFRDDFEFRREVANFSDFISKLHLVDTDPTHVEIPKVTSDGTAIDFIQSSIDSHKDWDGAVGGKLLQLVYYRGHGVHDQERKTLMATSRYEAGAEGYQAFDWNALQWNRDGVTSTDTVVFLDCNHAGAAIQPSLQGCKEVFVSCSATGKTAGPGEDSFSQLLVRAGSSFGDEFSLSDWVDETTLMDIEIMASSGYDRLNLPVHKTYGDLHSQVLFKQGIRAADKKERERTSAIFAAFEILIAAGVVEAKDVPTGLRFRKLKNHPTLLRGDFTPKQVYEAFGALRDGEARRKMGAECQKVLTGSPMTALEVLRSVR